jgi:uncharacterized membrane protein YgdD (TMEM256/DUF423 family)
MWPRIWIVLGGLLAATGIGMSAYHAHGLEAMLSKHALEASQMQRLTHDFEAAYRFQLYHGMALVVVGLLALGARSAWFHVAGVLMFLGTLAFSGALYILVLAGERLPHLAPIGGVSLIAGWVALAIGGLLCGEPKRAGG